jgi:C-terminal processing protease CtpA/Prc
MKNFIIFILVVVAVLTIVSAPRLLKHSLKNTAKAPKEPAVAEEVTTEAVIPIQEVALVRDTLTPEKGIPPAVKKPTPPKVATAPPSNPALRYWERMARQFERQQGQLAREMDPAKRLALIRAMSGYVRMDTLSAIDWAMSLQDPSEQQAALEAINNKALVGIGARIQVDETGLPRIQETTVMSAVAASGRVEPGDYIVGMDDGTGAPVYFEGVAAHKVAQQLRGQPGTELRLLMERVAPDGNTAQGFEVIVHRSLLVVEPPH